MALLTPLILAQNGGSLPDTGTNGFGTLGGALNSRLDVLVAPESLASILNEITLVWAVIFIIVGILCVLHGYRWHKILMVVLAALFGVWAGTALGGHVGSKEIAGACLAVLFAILAWPLMRYAVALFGGLAGAFAGANIWSAVGQNPDMHYVGALIGLLVVGMLAFMAFRVVVVVLTTVGGASLLVFGVTSALLQVDPWQEGISTAIENNRLMIPLIAASAAAVGAIYQFSGGVRGMSEHADKADSAKVKANAKPATT